MPNLYIIAGPNGAGKTTASFTILPEILNCNEFINADEIARGLSPFKPEKAAIESGRIMLRKIKQNIKHQIDFAFETTLATKGYVNTIEYSREYGYKATLLFFWLNNPLLAIERVKARVAEGGHNIPTDIIERRYYSGLKNLFRLYLAKCNYWLILNNSNPVVEIIAEGSYDSTIKVENIQLFEKIKKTSYGK